MKDYIINYYSRIRECLLKANEEEADVESIAQEVDMLSNEFFEKTDEAMATNNISECLEQNAVWGLIKKFERLHGSDYNFVNRDTISLLSMKIDLGFGNYPPSCPYSGEDFPNIQKEITTYLSQRVKTPDVEDSTPLLKGVVKMKLSQDQMKYLTDNIIYISHSLTEYVDDYDVGNWNWSIDIYFIAQYVFEKAAELTYKVVKGETPVEFEYDIREAFSYFQLFVPDTFQMKLDSVVGKLENIVLDLTSFIEKNEYYLCDKESWFRPVVFNIALEGMIYTLEQDL